MSCVEYFVYKIRLWDDLKDNRSWYLMTILNSFAQKSHCPALLRSLLLNGFCPSCSLTPVYTPWLTHDMEIVRPVRSSAVINALSLRRSARITIIWSVVDELPLFADLRATIVVIE